MGSVIVLRKLLNSIKLFNLTGDTSLYILLYSLMCHVEMKGEKDFKRTALCVYIGRQFDFDQRRNRRGKKRESIMAISSNKKGGRNLI